MARSGVYSTRFALTEVSAGTTSLYTVPADVVAVIRSITAVPSSTGTKTIYLELQGTPVLSLSGADGTTGPDGSFSWEGRIVALAGEEIGIETSEIFTLQVSGYLLSP